LLRWRLRSDFKELRTFMAVGSGIARPARGLRGPEISKN
jgi:hypothetical protein